MASTQKAKIPVGFVIAGKYRVTGELGRGGMASVYEAENVDIGKRVAIKVLAQELISSTIVVERFLREARAVAAIRSPYICDVYDSGRLDDGRPFLVLELLEGESLYERMVRVGTIDLETTVGAMAQTCRGLTRAHATGIVHRDLKPENIFVTKDEEGALLCKILDFGLAKFYQPVEDGAAQARLTREGAVFGTPAYMSPEQVRGQGAVDARADLWALGCITYECLTGRTVWATDQGVAMTFAQIAQGVLPDPLTYRPDLPLSFKAWFVRALHRDIAERFQTPKEFAEELMVATNIGARVGETSSMDIFPSRRGLESNAHPSIAERASQTTTNPNPSGPTGSNAGVIPAPTQLSHETSPNSGNVPLPEAPPAKSSGGAGKTILVLGFLAALGAGGYYGYRKMNPPVAPTASASASTSTDPALALSSIPSATSPPSSSAPVHSVGLPWRATIAEAQDLLAKGDFEGARIKMKAAVDESQSHATPTMLLQQLETVKAANKKEPNCKLTGVTRPRFYDLLEDKAKRSRVSNPPSIAVGPAGAVIVWTESVDNNEQAFAVGLDEAMRARTKPFAVTPEAQIVQRPKLYTMGEKFLLTYWDQGATDPGIYARFLNSDGFVGMGAVKIAQANRALGGFSAQSPAVTLLPDGNLLFVWTEPSDKTVEDVYARRFDMDLKPVGEEIRVTSFAPKLAIRTKAVAPVIGVEKDALRIVFVVDRPPERLMANLRVPFEALTAPGQDGSNAKLGGQDKHLGTLELMSPPRSKVSITPEMSCFGETCMSVWHESNKSGVWAAMLTSGTANALFKREVVRDGREPGIAVNVKGEMQLVWFEAGKIITSSINRDGIGDTSVIGWISPKADQSALAMSAGLKEREWYIAWRDVEGGVSEPFAMRVECR